MPERAVERVSRLEPKPRPADTRPARWAQSRLLGLVFLLGLMAAWEGLIRFFRVPPFLAPAPSAVVQSLLAGLVFNAFTPYGYYEHLAYTVGEALLGFLIGSTLGVLVGAILTQSALVERLALPYLFAFQTVPKVALAPILVIYLGFGPGSKVVMAALLTFFPLLVNTMAGLRAVDQDQTDLMRWVRANPWRRFRLVQLPVALPYVFAGLNMGVIYALLGAIVGEFVGAQMGLGVLLIQMNHNLDMKGSYSIFVVLSVVGVLLHRVMSGLQRRVVFWQRASERTVNA